MPTVATGYDSATGRVVSTTDTAPTPDATIAREFDALGRQSAYVDAAGGRTETVYDWLGQIASTKQYSNGSTPLTTTFTYDADRGLLTGLVDPVAGTFTATYDLDGQLLTQTMPGGVTMTQTLDTTATPLTRSYATSGGVLMTETVTENVHGQWTGRTRADAAAAGSEQAYSYDANGRLTQVAETASGCTTTRAYAFDRNSNRTSLTTTLATGCTGTAPATVNSTYDSADRLIATGYVYDALGRTTTAPLPNGTASLEYHTNDLIRRQAVATERQTWTLDPGMRLHAWTTETESGGTWSSTGSKTNHYDDDGDSPAWIDEGGGAITRTVGGIAGDLAATTTATGAIKLQLATLHGDVGQEIALANSTTIDSAVPTAFRDADEYGNAKPTGYDQDGNPVYATARYGWLGAKQRSTETLGNTLTLMGVRLYNPATGRFLTVDPVRGGNPNAYTYPVDPINMFDLDGRWGFKKIGGFINRHKVSIGMTALGFVPGVGAAAWAYRGYRTYRTVRGLRTVRSFGSCRANSFTPETLVVMADGSNRRIETVRIGELVLAADTTTGKTQPETVTDVITSSELKDLVTVEIDARNDGSATPVVATLGHPIFTLDDGWVAAGDLRAGDRLRTLDGSEAQVQSVARHSAVQTVHNLTVDNLHTYYVVADDTAALVHNCALRNNNIIRWGPTYQGGPFRVSLGAQTRYWNRMPAWRQRLQPYHVHMERARGGITHNPSGRSVRLWGNWQ